MAAISAVMRLCNPYADRLGRTRDAMAIFRWRQGCPNLPNLGWMRLGHRNRWCDWPVPTYPTCPTCLRTYKTYRKKIYIRARRKKVGQVGTTRIPMRSVRLGQGWDEVGQVGQVGTRWANVSVIERYSSASQRPVGRDIFIQARPLFTTSGGVTCDGRADDCTLAWIRALGYPLPLK
jgi:hypothetical protein